MLEGLTLAKNCFFLADLGRNSTPIWTKSGHEWTRHGSIWPQIKSGRSYRPYKPLGSLFGSLSLSLSLYIYIYAYLGQTKTQKERKNPKNVKMLPSLSTICRKKYFLSKNHVGNLCRRNFRNSIRFFFKKKKTQNLHKNVTKMYVLKI